MTRTRPPEKIEVHDIIEYVRVVSNIGLSIYRGQVENWPLLPGISRPYLDDAHQRNPYLEKNLLERFRLNAAAYLPALERTTPLDWWRCMALGQHHGLPTRLLDWTYSPLAALYFAVERPPSNGNTSVVYALPKLEVRTFAGLAKRTDGPPWEYRSNRLAFLHPDVTQPRIYAQAGVFSVHPGVPVTQFGSEIYEEGLVRIEITKDRSSDLARDLYRLGMSRARLFPDPDAVSATLVWEVKNEMDWISD